VSPVDPELACGLERGGWGRGEIVVFLRLHEQICLIMLGDGSHKECIVERMSPVKATFLVA
jgi:hypothetical protein